jgi:cytochrome P450
MAFHSVLDLGYPSLFFLSTILLLTISTLRSHLKSYSLRKGCRPPPSIPQKDPFLGLDIIYGRFTETYEKRSRDTIARDLFAKYGHVFQSFPYGVAEIVTEIPEHVKAIYGTDFESWGVGPLRSFGLKPLAGNGLMSTDGPVWKAHRSVLTSILAQAAHYQESFEQHVERLLALIPEDGSTIDLQPLFDRLAMDSSSEILFGESTLTLLPDTSVAAVEFLNAYNYSLRGVGMRMVLPFWDFLSRDPKFWSSCKEAQAFVDRILDNLMNTATPANDVQKYSVAYGLASLGQDRVQIRDELLGLFLPFHDAIAAPLTNISFNLARNPQAWTKLQNEISTVGSASLTPKLVKSLKYLHAVINETMRLYHGLSSNERIALRDTVLPTGGGPDGTAPIFVNKGVKVVIWFATMARRKDIWGDDADIWRPERWDGDFRPDRWINFPFGAGPRMCPASDLGVTQIAITTIRVLQKFKTIENRDPVEEFIDRWRVTTASKNGAQVGLSL